MARTPIICFHIVEYCQPDRCMRQFGRDQPIPRRPRKLKGVHDLTLKGKKDENWVRKLRPFISRWQLREKHIDVPPQLHGLLSPNSEYMDWYRLRGKRYVSKRGARLRRGIDGMEMLYYATEPENLTSCDMGWVHSEIGRLLAVFREQARVEEPGPSAPPSQLQDEPQLSADVPRGRQEGLGLGRQRQAVPLVPDPIRGPRPRLSGIYRPPVLGPTYGSQPVYYQAPQPDYVPDPTFYSQAPQSQPVYPASPVAMASGPGESSSHDPDMTWTQDDVDELLRTSFDPELDFGLGDPSPSTSVMLEPHTAAHDFVDQQTLDVDVPAPDPDPLPDASPLPVPSRPLGYTRGVGRRRLPDRQARHQQWPPPSA